MTWLKKIGTDIAAGISKVMPFLTKTLPVVAAVGQQVGAVISAVDPAAAPLVDTFEAIIGKVIDVEGSAAAIAGSTVLTGAQKATAAGALVNQVILAMPFMADKTITNQKAFSAACAVIAGAVADLTNTFAPATTPPVPPALPTPA